MSASLVLSGGSGNDKIDMGEGHAQNSSTAEIQAFGGDGDDIIYGAENTGTTGTVSSTAIKIYGDTDYVDGVGTSETRGGRD